MSQKKKIWVTIVLFGEMAIGKDCHKGLDLKKKRIGFAKSSSFYKSNNKFETCPMTICG
jgi:hypothetical protein